MPLIASVSGIRGVFGNGLDAGALVRYASAFGAWARDRSDRQKPLVVIGRDGRMTGPVCARLVSGALMAAGCDVIDTGLATTPTIAMAVEAHHADGAVILSASHNPAQWNALKLLSDAGEFLDAEQGRAVLDLAEQDLTEHTAAFDATGAYATDDRALDRHIEAILALPYVDAKTIRERDFHVIVDGINSVGAFALPALLEALGVLQVEVLNEEVTGNFAHDPEPRPDHLTGLTARVAETGADLGIAVDPDADRLAFVEDGGRFFGEELTQVVAADFLLGKKTGPVATNLSSSRALEDIAARHGVEVHRSPVGEIHVVRTMQRVSAVIGGEGNGGVILPDLHYGRDALGGTALVLQHLAETGQALSDIRADYPTYHIAKHKLPLTEDFDAGAALRRMAALYIKKKDATVSTSDGVKVDLPEGWVHMRTSNTEPIVRVYAEAETEVAADDLAERFKRELQEG